jgi:hypothetical protein
MRELLAEKQRTLPFQFTEKRSWLARTFLVTGSPHALAALAKDVDEWRWEQLSREAW